MDASYEKLLAKGQNVHVCGKASSSAVMDFGVSFRRYGTRS